MKMDGKKAVLALVGMPGAGKTEAAKFFSLKGLPVIRFGSITDQGLDEMELAHTETNERIFRERLRKQLGMAAYAIRIRPQIEAVFKKNKIVVLDGLRSWQEYRYLKRSIKNFFLLAILAPSSIRHKRLTQRFKRRISLQQVRSRDKQELATLNICPTILFATFFVINDGTRVKLHQQLEEVLAKVYEQTKNQG